MHKEGVDFVIVSYCKHDYVRLCVESIKKFVDVPYTIHVVVNYLEKEKEMNLHEEMRRRRLSLPHLAPRGLEL